MKWHFLIKEKSEYISEQVAALAAIFVTQAQVGEQNLKKNKKSNLRVGEKASYNQFTYHLRPTLVSTFYVRVVLCPLLNQPWPTT